MKRTVLILIAVLAVVLSQPAEAQRGRRDASQPTPTAAPIPTPFPTIQKYISISADGDWVVDQPNSCRLNLPSSAQYLHVLVDGVDKNRQRIPVGSIQLDNSCLIRFLAELPQGDSYNFSIDGESIADIDSDEFERLEIIPLSLNAPVEGPESENQVTSTTQPGSSDSPTSVRFQVRLFVEESLMGSSPRSCQFESHYKTPLLIVTAVDLSASSERALTNGVYSVDSVYGINGCVFDFSVQMEVSEEYRFRALNTILVDIEHEALVAQDVIDLAVGTNGSLTKPAKGMVLPTPIPSPTPLPTPLPTPTPIPAGDQGDGIFLLRGYIDLNSEDNQTGIEGCSGYGNYGDIGPGTQVVVRDGENNVLGIGELIAIEPEDDKISCTFVFEISVETTSFYQVAISFRVNKIYSFDDLEDHEWTVYLTLDN